MDPERVFPGMAFYPRICFGRVILSAAKWKFKAADLLPLFDGKEQAVDRFRKKHHLPRWVSTGSYDQQLVFDLSDRRDAAFFLECAAGLKEMTLLEYLSPVKEVTAGHRPLAAQYIGFLYHERSVYKPLEAWRPKTERAVKRAFPPGSDWLYLKLYCTPLTADRILGEVIGPLLEKSADLIICWFFIRYTDPGYHLRLRFKVKKRDGGKLLADLCDALAKTGHDRLVHALQADTYNRELERYGARLIERVEQVFWRGSELVLKSLLSAGRGNGTSEFDIAFATALHMVFIMAGREGAAGFAGEVSDRFLAEYKADKALRISLDGKYRQLQAGLHEVLGARRADEGLMGALRQITGAAARNADGRRQLTADLVHMQLNRTFSTEGRKQELVVWYCLSKYLRSLTARKR